MCLSHRGPSDGSSVRASYSSTAIPIPIPVSQVFPCDDVWWVLSPACGRSALSHALPVTASASGGASLTAHLPPVALQGASSTPPL